MKKQKSSHISEFNEGEIVTRVEPAFNDMRDHVKNPINPKIDYSYVGDCLKYLGRTGSKIYFRNYSYKKPFEKKGKFSLNYEIFKNGWAYAEVSNIYQEPLKNLDLENFEDICFYFNHMSNMERNCKIN